MTIEFLGPLVVALVGARRLLDALWALLAAGGVVLLAESRGDLSLAGMLFALAAGACWGSYILLSAALGSRTTEGNGLALGMAVAAPVAMPVGVAWWPRRSALPARRRPASPDRSVARTGWTG